jgi:hypothetical protein
MKADAKKFPPAASDLRECQHKGEMLYVEDF